MLVYYLQQVIESDTICWYIICSRLLRVTQYVGILFAAGY